MSEMAGCLRFLYLRFERGPPHTLWNAERNPNDEGYANVKAALTSAAQNVPIYHPIQCSE